MNEFHNLPNGPVILYPKKGMNINDIEKQLVFEYNFLNVTGTFRYEKNHIKTSEGEILDTDMVILLYYVGNKKVIHIKTLSEGAVYIHFKKGNLDILLRKEKLNKILGNIKNKN